MTSLLRNAGIHERNEGVEALVDRFALAGSAVHDRVAVGTKAKRPRELLEVREERCFRDVDPEVALNDQSLAVNIRGDGGQRRLVHPGLP